MPYLLKTFREAVNGTPATLTAEIQAWFVANPTIQVVSVTSSRFFSTSNSEQLVIRMVYRTAVGFQHRADLISGSASVDLATAYTVFAMVNPTYYKLFGIETSARSSRIEDHGSIIVISTTVQPRFGSEMFIAEPLANIAAGATGDARIFISSGVEVAVVPVVNVGSTLWVMGERSLVFYDQATGALIGLAACCP